MGTVVRSGLDVIIVAGWTLLIAGMLIVGIMLEPRSARHGDWWSVADACYPVRDPTAGRGDTSSGWRNRQTR